MLAPLITFEGGEGAGKTTLIDSVFSILTSEGYSVVKTREPGGTILGEEIRKLLLHHKTPVAPFAELALFLASRAQHIEEKILPLLKGGTIVLCDRFNDSTIAYQGAARGLGVEKVQAACSLICSGVEPSLTIYLDILPEIGLARAKKDRSADRIESESISFHTKIREVFLSLHQKNSERIHLISAEYSADHVLRQAMGLVHSIILTFGLDSSAKSTNPDNQK